MDGRPPDGGSLQGDSLAGALFREAADALLLVDPLSERVLDANPAARRLTGLPDADLRGASVRALVLHEQGWQDWLPPLHLAAPAEPGEGFLLRTADPDRPVPVGVSFARLEPTGGPPVVLFTLRDRRPQAEAARRVQRAEGELRRVLMSVRDGLWSCRVEAGGGRRYRYLSPAVEGITGRPVSALLEDADAWQRLVEPDDLPRWLAFRARQEAGYSAELTYRLRRPDGTVAQVRENVLAAPDDEGLLLYGVLCEVGGPPPASPLDRLAGLTRLAGTLAHDFNNLVTGILGHVSLAEMPGGDTADALRQIKAIAHRAADLCRQLAMFAGKGKGGNTPQDLNGVAREATAELSAGLPAGQALLADLADDLPPVAGDPAQLRVVVTNLLTNAVESLGGAAGRVVVRTRLAARPWPAGPGPAAFDFGDAAAGTPGVCLEVRDEGPGVPTDLLPHLFEPFVTTRPGRRGLGLAAVFCIVRAHRGAIHLDSRPSGGTTARVYLPAAPRPAPPPPPRPPTGSCGAVLLADDEASVLDVAGRLLDTLGCRVLHASDGRQALDLFARHADEVRLALLDLTMPGLGGDAVARELLRRAPALPVVLMSGYSQGDVLARVGDLPLAGYLQKPFRLSALAALLERLLPH